MPTIRSRPAENPPPLRVAESNLNDLASNAASQGFELVFFPQLRQELKSKLDQSPHVVRFHGLRGLCQATGRRGPMEPALPEPGRPDRRLFANLLGRRSRRGVPAR